VVTAAILTALPVSSAERYSAGTTTHVTATHAVAMTAVTHVVLRRSHHTRVAITTAVSRVSHGISGRWALLHGGERATETSSAALEVGEAARRAVPVTGTRAVLARREWSNDLGSAVEDATRGGRDLNSLLVERATIHAKALSSLDLSVGHMIHT
jgi:hypothetical protein